MNRNLKIAKIEALVPFGMKLLLIGLTHVIFPLIQENTYLESMTFRGVPLNYVFSFLYSISVLLIEMRVVDFLFKRLKQQVGLKQSSIIYLKAYFYLFWFVLEGTIILYIIPNAIVEYWVHVISLIHLLLALLLPFLIKEAVLDEKENNPSHQRIQQYKLLRWGTACLYMLPLVIYLIIFSVMGQAREIVLKYSSVPIIFVGLIGYFLGVLITMYLYKHGKTVSATSSASEKLKKIFLRLLQLVFIFNLVPLSWFFFIGIGLVVSYAIVLSTLPLLYLLITSSLT